MMEKKTKERNKPQSKNFNPLNGLIEPDFLTIKQVCNRLDCELDTLCTYIRQKKISLYMLSDHALHCNTLNKEGEIEQLENFSHNKLPFIFVVPGFFKIDTEHLTKALNIGSSRVDCVYDDNDEPMILSEKWNKALPSVSIDTFYLNVEEVARFYNQFKFDSLRPIEQKKFESKKNDEEHENYYRAYHKEQVKKYLNGEIKKPWQAWDKEEPIISKLMKSGFSRDKFRKARNKVLAHLPGCRKTNLSKNDHATLKAYLSKQNQES